MARTYPLFTVEDAFLLKGRVVVLGQVPAHWYDYPEFPVRTGDKLELRMPDGSSVGCSVLEVGKFTAPLAGPCERRALGIMVDYMVAAPPRGAEVQLLTPSDERNRRGLVKDPRG